MSMIREQRIEEARIRQENRSNAREDVEYDRKREDTLEDYKAKKDIDLEYRQKAGIGSGGSGGGQEKYQVMTMEDGSQRLVTKADLQRMHSQGYMGFEVSDQEGNSKILKGALGSPRGSSSSPNTLKDARLIASAIEERYGGAPNPDSDDPQEQADYEDYRLARQHIRAGLGGESGGFLSSQGRPGPQAQKLPTSKPARAPGGLSYSEGAEVKSKGAQEIKGIGDGDIVRITLHTGRIATIKKIGDRARLLSVD
jgi:hypothetical protein